MHLRLRGWNRMKDVMQLSFPRERESMHSCLFLDSRLRGSDRQSDLLFIPLDVPNFLHT
jgi:hypothetical protein